jgi:hypothetical protein
MLSQRPHWIAILHTFSLRVARSPLLHHPSNPSPVGRHNPHLNAPPRVVYPSQVACPLDFLEMLLTSEWKNPKWKSKSRKACRHSCHGATSSALKRVGSLTSTRKGDAWGKVRSRGYWDPDIKSWIVRDRRRWAILWYGSP